MLSLVLNINTQLLVLWGMEAMSGTKQKLKLCFEDPVLCLFSGCLGLAPPTLNLWNQANGVWDYSSASQTGLLVVASPPSLGREECWRPPSFQRYLAKNVWAPQGDKETNIHQAPVMEQSPH